MGSTYSSIIFFFLAAVRVSTRPSGSITETHLSRMASGAPLTYSLLDLSLESRTRTLILFRSRMNSRVATLSSPFSQYADMAIASSPTLRLLSPKNLAVSPSSGHPIFSTSTRRAASVGSPIRLYLPSESREIRDVLHTAPTRAKCCRATSLVEIGLKPFPIFPTGA